MGRDGQFKNKKRVRRLILFGKKIGKENACESQKAVLLAKGNIQLIKVTATG